MIGPYRLRRSDNLAPIQGATFQDYLDRLLKMIPAEVIGLYLVGSGLIPAQQVPVIVWTAICLVAVIVVRIYGTTDTSAKNVVDWPHVVISAVAFIIWVYTIGNATDPFVVFGIYQAWIGSVLVLVWTFFVPIFYRGAD